jgi:hypothetical protein
VERIGAAVKRSDARVKAVLSTSSKIGVQGGQRIPVARDTGGLVQTGTQRPLPAPQRRVLRNKI